MLVVALTRSWAPSQRIMGAILAASDAVGPSMLARGVVITGCVTALTLIVSVVIRFVVEIPATHAMNFALARSGSFFRLQDALSESTSPP